MSTQQLQIYCKNIDRYIPVEGGETLSDIYARIAPEIEGFQPVCALVNYKNEGLTYRVYMPKHVEFLGVTSPSGGRTYVRSLCMMLYRAVSELFPGVRLKIEHSLSRGYFCRMIGLPEGVKPDAETVELIKGKMHELVGRRLPFEPHQVLTSHAVDIFERQHLYDKSRLLKTLHTLYTTYYTLDGVADYYYGCLAPHTGLLGVFDLISYHDGMLLTGPDPENISVARKPVAQPKMFNAFTDYLRFNQIVGVTNVGELNEAVARGDSPMLINVSEALHDKRISTIADSITERFHKGEARIVLIAGPSSSGKTTFTKRLAIHLMTNLINPQMISLDNYFVDREHTPRDADGEFDYESLYALDLEAFNSDLVTLINGGEVSLPYYNFETGARQYRGDKIHLGSNTVLLIEGIHGLNPELTDKVEERMKFKIYVSALTTINIDNHNWIPTTDNRLLRRIIRDHKYRGASAVDTIKRWPSVRRGEEKWIFPYQENADATFNSSLLFELGVLRTKGEDILSSVPHDLPEYGEAHRLKHFLNYFSPISERYIPSTSLIREFLGGSSFNY